jgi:hypothetical protein
MDLADLFSSDEHVRLEAHRVLPDADLLFAALMIDAEPVPFGYGAEAQNRADRLAQLCASAKTLGGAGQIARVASESCRPWFLLQGIAKFGGLDVQDVENRYRTERSFDNVGAYASYVASMSFGPAFVNAVLNAEIRYIRGGKQITDQHTLICKLVKHETDTELIFSTLRGLGQMVAAASIERLIELQATDCIDRIAENPASFFLKDKWVRLIIANASFEYAETLATTSNLSFIYRRAAMERLNDEQVTDVAASSPHQNVRDSANEVLKMRGLVAA